MPPRMFVCVPRPSLSVYGVRVLQNHYCSQAKQAAAKILLSFARIERECGRVHRFRWSRKRSGSHRFVILLASMSPIKSLTPSFGAGAKRRSQPRQRRQQRLVMHGQHGLCETHAELAFRHPKRGLSDNHLSLVNQQLHKGWIRKPC